MGRPSPDDDPGNVRAMLTLIRSLCDALAGPALIEEIAQTLGRPAEDGRPDLALSVTLADPALRAVTVARASKSGAPAHVRLEMSAPSHLMIADLQAAFGPFQRPPKLHWRHPTALVFHVDTPGQPHTCAIIVTIEDDDQSPEDMPVVALTLRRDERIR